MRAGTDGRPSCPAQELAGAAWQRCRVHFVRTVQAHVPKADKPSIAAAVRTVFAQPNQEAAWEQVAEVVETMEPFWPKAATVQANGDEDVLVYTTFPAKHRMRFYSTHALKRPNREGNRPAGVASILPDAGSVLRPAGSNLAQVGGELRAGRRSFSLGALRKPGETDRNSLALPMPPGPAPVRWQGEEAHAEKQFAHHAHREAPANLRRLTRHMPKMYPPGGERTLSEAPGPAWDEQCHKVKILRQ